MGSTAFDNIFRACGICSRSCFERHGNRTNEAALPGSPSFLRLLGDHEMFNSLSSLGIPSMFMAHNGCRIQDTVTLKGPTGFTGEALVVHDNGYSIQGGWKEFVKHENVASGDTVLCTLIADSVFGIRFYDKFGCEKTFQSEGGFYAESAGEPVAEANLQGSGESVIPPDSNTHGEKMLSCEENRINENEQGHEEALMSAPGELGCQHKRPSERESPDHHRKKRHCTEQLALGVAEKGIDEQRKRLQRLLEQSRMRMKYDGKFEDSEYEWEEDQVSDLSETGRLEGFSAQVLESEESAGYEELYTVQNGRDNGSQMSHAPETESLCEMECVQASDSRLVKKDSNLNTAVHIMNKTSSSRHIMKDATGGSPVEQRRVSWLHRGQSQSFVSQGQMPFSLAEKALTSYCGTSCEIGGDGAYLQKGILVELSDDESEGKREHTSTGGEGHPMLQQRVRMREVASFRSRSPTTAERQAAIDLANEVCIINPHTCIAMKHSQVCAGFSVSLGLAEMPNVTTDAILYDTAGGAWQVKWLVNSSGKRLSAGWRKFAVDHQLDEGDVCIFEIVKKDELSLLVHIFPIVILDDQSGTESPITMGGEMKLPVTPTVPIDPSAASSFLGNGDCEDGGVLKGLPFNYSWTLSSRRRPITMEERRCTEATARAFETQNPSTTVIMRNSSVYRHFDVSIPSMFAKRWLPSALMRVTLIDSAGQSFTARWIGNRKKSQCLKSFRDFSISHCLEEGDACVFELMDPNPGTSVFKVHIFRVVELKSGQCGPDDWQKHYHCLTGRGLYQEGENPFGTDLEVVPIGQEATDPPPLSHRVEQESFQEENLEEPCSLQHNKSSTFLTEQSRRSIREAIYSEVLRRKVTRQNVESKLHLIDEGNIRFPEPNTCTPIHHEKLRDSTLMEFDFSRARTGSGIEVETATKSEPIVKANIPRSACIPDVSLQEERHPAGSIVPQIVREDLTVSKKPVPNEDKLKSQQLTMGALGCNETSTVPANCPDNRQHISERELMHHLDPEIDS